MAEKSQGTVNTDFGVDNRPILDLKVSKEAYWKGLSQFVRFFLSKWSVFKESGGVENQLNSLLWSTLDSWNWRDLYIAIGPVQCTIFICSQVFPTGHEVKGYFEYQIDLFSMDPSNDAYCSSNVCPTW